MKKILSTLAVLSSIALTSTAALAADRPGHGSHLPPMKNPCAGLPTYAELKTALTDARKKANGGFDLDMWGTVVNRDGMVCAVAFTGTDRADQWPGSRVISAQKANTANAFSLTGLPLSTANLYTATQPSGSLFGLQESNPVDTSVAYGGSSDKYGTKTDYMVGKKIGGINVFGGGLALYNADKKLVGAVGVSGDSSCADHNIAWRTRESLALNNIPGGVGPKNAAGMGTDGIDYTVGGDWSHPVCSETSKTIATNIGAGK